jgi:hypothetical protein
MLAVIQSVRIIGTGTMAGSGATNVFSQVNSAKQRAALGQDQQVALKAEELNPTRALCMPPGYSSSPSTLSNPAHILIGRNNRTFSSSPHTSSSASPHHHHASPADPLQSTIAASGTFPRQSASPPWLFEEMIEDEHENTYSCREDGGEAIPIDVDSTFTKDGRWPGTVKIVVEATTFWYALTGISARDGDYLPFAETYS